jgi:hypothetical protein
VAPRAEFDASMHACMHAQHTALPFEGRGSSLGKGGDNEKQQEAAATTQPTKRRNNFVRRTAAARLTHKRMRAPFPVLRSAPAQANAVAQE